MTVQELIDELTKIEDKSKEVLVYSYDDDVPADKVIQGGNNIPEDSVLIM